MKDERLPTVDWEGIATSQSDVIDALYRRARRSDRMRDQALLHAGIVFCAGAFLGALYVLIRTDP